MHDAILGAVNTSVQKCQNGGRRSHNHIPNRKPNYNTDHNLNVIICAAAMLSHADVVFSLSMCVCVSVCLSAQELKNYCNLVRIYVLR